MMDKIAALTASILGFLSYFFMLDGYNNGSISDLILIIMMPVNAILFMLFAIYIQRENEE